MHDRLGIVYACNPGYLPQTVISLTSVLDANERAKNHRVELEVYILMDNWTDTDRLPIKEICEQYKVKSHFIECSHYNEWFASKGLKEYGTSYSCFYQMVISEFIDVEFPLLYLEGDVVMHRGQNLQDLANWSFERDGQSFAYAANIDPENFGIMRKALRFSDKQHYCNVGVLLISTTNHKKLKCKERLQYVLSNIGAFTYNADMSLFNYVFRDLIMILPLKYQIYPAYKLMKYNEVLFSFSIKKKDFYSAKEYIDAVNAPCFIHFVNMISVKPWYMDMDKEYPPYREEWDYAKYKSRTLFYKNLSDYDFSRFEKFKRWMYKNLRVMWLISCKIMFVHVWKKRLKDIRDYKLGIDSGIDWDNI